jgi:hypothetical protein
MWFGEETVAVTKEKTAGRKNFEQIEIEEENAGKEIEKNSDEEMTALASEMTDWILEKRKSETGFLSVEKIELKFVLETVIWMLG